jgi:hypothetical protein
MIEAHVSGEPCIDSVTATDAGEVWLAEHPSFQRLVDGFLELEGQSGGRPEWAFKDNPYIGMGGRSEVWEVGGAAIKLSTPTTGRHHWLEGERTVENLKNQYTFLQALGRECAEHDEYGITIPDQLLVVRTSGGNYIRAERYMRGWQSVYALVQRLGVDETEKARVSEAIKARIKGTIGQSVLFRMGLNEIGLRRNTVLYAQNVLLPKGTPKAELADARICIIDQPSDGFSGKVAAALLRQTAPRRTGHHLALCYV